YDELNGGTRFSDLNDVKKAIARAREHNQKVLLDFHLSDNWADPGKQLVPEAWLAVVDDIDILKDSLYNYIFKTLSILNDEDLVPEMIQIGNETNKGILLSPEDNATWTLDWTRNAILFNEAIKAVRDFQLMANEEVQIMLHLAGPGNAEWLIDGFIQNGVTDFDIIGLSYYWAWHKPTTIVETGEIINTMRKLYPDKEVMVVETGYIWTTEWNDAAGNIISETHPDYHPASPQSQKRWLTDLTEEVMASGGSAVIYWEPAWVSSPCYTQWGQGSHQEHATFFDFDNNLLIPGGIEWMEYDYNMVSTSMAESTYTDVQILFNSFSGDLKIIQHKSIPDTLSYYMTDTLGNILLKQDFSERETETKIDEFPFGIYLVIVSQNGKTIKSRKVVFNNI
ncbi:MAG: hypothetical protein HKN67_08020, partial [Saprospiraceae bacterium]|nr:hypothetical protein [Saprospiraceae bacterium]